METKLSKLNDNLNKVLLDETFKIHEEIKRIRHEILINGKINLEMRTILKFLKSID
jgi:hypothetical protein